MSDETKSPKKPTAPQFSPITRKAPKHHAPVVVRESANGKHVEAVRKPEGWYQRGKNVGIGFTPTEFRPL